MKNLLYSIFLVGILLFSCSNSDNSYEMGTSKKEAYPESSTVMEEATDELAMETTSEPSANQSSTPIQVTERKIIKEGSIGYEATDLKQARDKVLEAVKQHNGYISSDTENKYYDRIQHNIVIRVPVGEFDNLLEKIISGVERLDSRDIKATDVTEEFLDVQARIKNKKELEARYLEILKKANTVSDILEVERQVGVLREEIESAEGRLKYLENQTSLSTLSVSFYQYIETEHGFGSEFSRGFANGWNNLVWFFVGIVNIWPFVIIFGVIIWLSIRSYRKRKAKKQAKTV